MTRGKVVINIPASIEIDLPIHVEVEGEVGAEEMTRIIKGAVRYRLYQLMRDWLNRKKESP